VGRAKLTEKAGDDDTPLSPIMRSWDLKDKLTRNKLNQKSSTDSFSIGNGSDYKSSRLRRYQ
jgi:hypothetical protein